MEVIYQKPQAQLKILNDSHNFSSLNKYWADAQNGCKRCFVQNIFGKMKI